MTEDEARATLIEAHRQIDWYNFGNVVSALGDQGYRWGKYHNGKWRPDYTRAINEIKWLQKNFEKLLEALDTLHKLK